MKNTSSSIPSSPSKRLLAAVMLWVFLAPGANAWWNDAWTARRKITIDATAAGAPINDPIGGATVLIRLHEGNFAFPSAREDGSDLRFVAADEKTLLPFHIEKYDPLMSEAFVWVKLPDVKPGAQTTFWVYSGNAGENVPRADDAKGSYDADTLLIYHFAEHGSAPADATTQHSSEKAGVAADGSMIGTGLRLDAQASVIIPAAPTFAWKEGAPLTLSVWIKPSALQPGAVIFTRREGSNCFVVGLDNGVPFAEVKSSAGTKRTSGGAPIDVNAWKHIAVIADGGKITLFLNGESYGTADAAIPALSGLSVIGVEKDAPGKPGVFTGEIDELEISRIARPVGAIKLAALGQGSEKSSSLLQFAAEDAQPQAKHSELSEHLSLFTDISKSLTFDGWVVIACCTLLAIIGWYVAVEKFIYLNQIEKGSREFLKQWDQLSSDLTVLDHSDAASLKTIGGASAKSQKLMRLSPLFHIYHIGSEEIHQRVSKSNGGFKGLSGRSIQAIRASLDGGLVREVQKLNGKLIFLTIGIAGGPYLGLLGTVIGVMITFAVIAKSGEVEVNSIAPGIAGALLATVAGLAVAIPALFAYSYLSSRIKDVVSTMQMFIDEFVTKMAELYPHENE